MNRFNQRVKQLLCEGGFFGKNKKVVAFNSKTLPMVALIYSVDDMDIAGGLFKIEGNKLVPPLRSWRPVFPVDMHDEIRIKAFLTQLAMKLNLKFIRGHGPGNPKEIYSLTIGK